MRRQLNSLTNFMESIYRNHLTGLQFPVKSEFTKMSEVMTFPPNKRIQCLLIKDADLISVLYMLPPFPTPPSCSVMIASSPLDSNGETNFSSFLELVIYQLLPPVDLSSFTISSLPYLFHRKQFFYSHCLLPYPFPLLPDSEFLLLWSSSTFLASV